MFNFSVGDAGVNENVFCYSNMHENERALVLYNNVYQSTAGWVKNSVGYNDGYGNIVFCTLAEALKIDVHQNVYTIFKDEINNFEYLRNNMDLANNGLYAELKGYNYQVFSSIREVYADDQNPYHRLNDKLQGRGVPSIELSLHELRIEPVLNALNRIFDQNKINQLIKGQATKNIIGSFEKARQEIFDFTGMLTNRKPPKWYIKNFSGLSKLIQKSLKIKFTKVSQVYFNSIFKNEKSFHNKYAFFIYLKQSQYILNAIEDDDKHIYYNSWLFEKTILQNSQLTTNDLALIKLFASYTKIISLTNELSPAGNMEIFQIPDIRNYLQINYYDNVYFLNKECWEELLDYLFIIEFFEVLTDTTQKLEDAVAKIIRRINFLKKSAKKTGYDLVKLITEISV